MGKLMMHSMLLTASVLFLSALLRCFSLSTNMDWFSICSASLFSCGNDIVDVGYPFWGKERPDRCGHPQLKLTCQNNITAILEMMSVKYHVLELNQTSQILKIARSDFSSGICSPEFGNTALDPNLFEYAPGSEDRTILYDCHKNYSLFFSDTNHFTCSSGRVSAYKDGYVLVDPQTEAGICNSSLTVGVTRESYYKAMGNSSTMERALAEGFEVKYKVDSACNQCTRFGGLCGSNATEILCFCPNQSSHVLSKCLVTQTPPEKKAAGSSLKPNWAVGVPAITLSGIIIIAVVIICFLKREQLSNELATAFWWKDRRNKFDVESFIRNNRLFAPRRYKYSHLKKMTDSFAENIGRGGYGTVYKGELADGRPVAVKVLSELNGNGEEFINEVVSMGRTSHVNIVSLLGFCYEKSKRALIYDFMPNGSLDKFIFNPNPRLEWTVLYDIAVGVARGLEYLHRGCKTRILHFDIKPQNILLDKDFCPKISDFGLAKLWLKDDSITSIMGARGTAGYIAPEVFSRCYGGVSHKSDVYSYGMLLLEMVGGKKNFESAASNSTTGEIYYQYWIYKDLEAGEDITSILGITSNKEKEILRKMILVSFWCIQTNPADRPSMTKVVEMMEGSLEFIEIPPKPFLFSLGNSHPHHEQSIQEGRHEHGDQTDSVACSDWVIYSPTDLKLSPASCSF